MIKCSYINLFLQNILNRIAYLLELVFICRYERRSLSPCDKYVKLRRNQSSTTVFLPWSRSVLLIPSILILLPISVPVPVPILIPLLSLRPLVPPILPSILGLVVPAEVGWSLSVCLIIVPPSPLVSPFILPGLPLWKLVPLSFPILLFELLSLSVGRDLFFLMRIVGDGIVRAGGGVEDFLLLLGVLGFLWGLGCGGRLLRRFVLRWFCADFIAVEVWVGLWAFRDVIDYLRLLFRFLHKTVDYLKSCLFVDLRLHASFPAVPLSRLSTF